MFIYIIYLLWWLYLISSNIIIQYHPTIMRFFLHLYDFLQTYEIINGMYQMVLILYGCSVEVHHYQILKD